MLNNKTRTVSFSKTIVLVGTPLLLGCLVFFISDLLYPNLWAALWTRAHYSSEDFLTNIDQYQNLEPIHGTSIQPAIYAPPSTRTKDLSETIRLKKMATITESNFVIIDLEGELLFETYQAVDDASPSMMTNSMSMAKSLVGLLVGVALKERRIESVDQEIGEFIDEFQTDQRGKITIRNLLQMESGLENQHNGFPLSHLQAMYFGGAPNARALVVPSVAPPGEVFKYNSVNSQLLLIILERQFGENFETLLSRYVWNPLELESGFSWHSSKGGDSKGFCCIFATARSWAEIGLIYLKGLTGHSTGPSVVENSWIRESLQESFPGSHYGYQIRIQPTDENSLPFYNFDGTPNQFVFIIPDLDVVAVRVGSQGVGFDGIEFISAVVEFVSVGRNR